MKWAIAIIWFVIGWWMGYVWRRWYEEPTQQIIEKLGNYNSGLIKEFEKYA